MEYSFNLPDFEDRRLTVKTANIFSKAQLMIDGHPAPKGPKAGQFLIQQIDGTELVIQLRISNIIDPVPKVIVDGKVITLADPLRWYQWLWAGLPLFLLAIGGALGGAFGGAATMANGRVFRSSLNVFSKYLVSGVISVAAVICFFASATTFNLAVRNFFPSPAHTYKSDAGGFSVITPADLVETTQTTNTKIGKIEIHTYSGNRGATYYAVAVTDFPKDLVQQNSAETLLDGSRNGAISNVKGTLISETKITLNGNPGREFTFEASSSGKAMKIKSRIYFVGARLYQSMVVSPKSEATDKAVDAFLQSFNLL